MGRVAHRIYILTLSLIVVVVTGILLFRGIPYYNTSLEERFFHSDHELFKPSGLLGHGLGIIGSLFMLVGVVIYIARKRIRTLSRLGQIKHWLEFHIFLCTLGPILVLFHTAFKFGGLVAVSFWSMVAVVASGVVGRFIYLQIPRTIEGKEMSLEEVKNLKEDLNTQIRKVSGLDLEYDMATVSGRHESIRSPSELVRLFRRFISRRSMIRDIDRHLRVHNLQRFQRKHITGLIKHEISLNRRIKRLHTMQKLFRYWHVAHLPFALVMLVIMVVHVVVTILFGNTWIF